MINDYIEKVAMNEVCKKRLPATEKTASGLSMLFNAGDRMLHETIIPRFK